jgi:hypothetical protein
LLRGKERTALGVVSKIHGTCAPNVVLLPGALYVKKLLPIFMCTYVVIERERDSAESSDRSFVRKGGRIEKSFVSAERGRGGKSKEKDWHNKTFQVCVIFILSVSERAERMTFICYS